MHIFIQTHCQKQDVTQDQLLNRKGLVYLISSLVYFPNVNSSWLVTLPRLQNPVCPIINPLLGKIYGFVPFLKAFVWSEMQTASSRFEFWLPTMITIILSVLRDHIDADKINTLAVLRVTHTYINMYKMTINLNLVMTMTYYHFVIILSYQAIRVSECFMRNKDEAYLYMLDI